MNFKKSLCPFFCLPLLLLIFTFETSAQDRSRVVQNAQKTQTNQTTYQNPTETVRKTVVSSPTSALHTRPTLTNKIVVVPPAQPLIKKTALSQPINAGASAAGKSLYVAPVHSKLMQGIQTRYGIPYLYGSTGPNRYDCSGFVWSVFNDAGIYFQRSSARTFWQNFEPVTGDERFKFGTLVFFNGLGHVGIVADEKGFFHASSSKGITYSPFEGYWGKRIVGFRRIPAQTFQTLLPR